ncbi:MAG: alpha-L-fucosidase [Sediminibacterium sp.]|nr:alpha-L-fucosidase [Sediminibacterium sp.]
MKKILRYFCFSCLFYFALLLNRVEAQTQIAKNPLPTAAQLKWHENNFYLFMHFGPNTFTNKEWGDGKEKTEVFNPKQLNTDQWCRIAKNAGAKGIIITAKHHDGFCLWPSKFSTHTIRESGFKRDVLAELSASCKKAGLLFGIYISPWDRNHPNYGTEKYNEVFVGMMKELFQQYGPIWELWWDGANGEGPNGKKQVYDWNLFESTVRNISPQTVIFSDIGPDIRWIGNEDGRGGLTNWNLLDTAGFKRGEDAPSSDTLLQGNYKGVHYLPAESDVSIRKGWFYHQVEDATVKSPDSLFAIYLQTVGRNANLLLNVPPNQNGLISAIDSAALMGFKQKRSIFEQDQLLNKAAISIGEPDKRNPNTPYSWYYILKAPQKIRGIILQEDLKYGQKISSARITISTNGQVKFQQTITTVGNQRILMLPQPIEATEVAFVVLGSKGRPVLKLVKAF